MYRVEVIPRPKDPIYAPADFVRLHDAAFWAWRLSKWFKDDRKELPELSDIVGALESGEVFIYEGKRTIVVQEVDSRGR